MSSPVCGGNFQNNFYVFDKDAKVYQYSNSTFLVETVSALSISNGSDSVRSIKKCVYNGADTIYFVGSTNDEPTYSLYSAALKANNTFSFKQLEGPASSILEAQNTTIFPVDRWSYWNGCVMLGYNINSIGVACTDDKFVANLNTDKAYNISNVKNSFTAPNGKLYQLLPDGILGYKLDNRGNPYILTSTPTLYKFEHLNTVNSNVTWKITVNEDSSHIVFYDANSNFQLLKLDNETFTAKMVNNTYKDMKPNSLVLFQNSNLIVIDKESYHTVPISQFSANIPSTNITSLPEPSDNTVTGRPKLDSAVAGGFTVLGIFIGIVLVFFIRYLWKRCCSKNRYPTRRMTALSRDSGTGLEENIAIPVESVPPVPPVPQLPPVTQVPKMHMPIHEQFIKRRPTFRSKVIDSKVGEGDPTCNRSSIFNKRCLIDRDDIGVASTNPLHHQEVFIRKCRYGVNHLPALIHYFHYTDGRSKFDRALIALNALKNQNSKNTIDFIDAIQLKLITTADRGFKYMLITSYYEPSQSLSALYHQSQRGDTVVDVHDETFIVWTIYSLLLAVKDLHDAGYVHRFITADSFYAQSNAPTTDWLLADFDEAGPAGEQYMMPADRCEYYDSTFNSSTFNYESDIWALGRVLYKVISGGREYQVYSNRNFSDCIEELVHGKTYGKHYRDLLKGTLCDIRYSKRLTANELVEIWESRFNFNQVE